MLALNTFRWLVLVCKEAARREFKAGSELLVFGVALEALKAFFFVVRVDLNTVPPGLHFLEVDVV